MKLTRFMLLLSAAAGAMTGTAVAQTPPAKPADSSSDVVVITAQKREQNLQDVPIAVSAFSAGKRDLLGITSVQDIVAFTPGLQYSTQTDRISLRGVGRLNNSHAVDASVAVYADGIYTTSTVQAGETPIFIDRVEVLRGPQGTLYGRNSVGGAINVVSRRPTKDWYAEVRGKYENYNHSLVEGAISGPLGDHVQFRVVGNWEKQTDGWFKNVSTNGAPDEGGIIDTKFGEAQLSIQFSPKLETWAKLSLIDWHNGGGGPGSRSSYSPSPYNLGQQTQANNLVPNAGFGYSGLATNVVSTCGAVNPASVDPRTFCADTPGTVKLNGTWIIANHWTYHANNFDIKYLTGGTHYHYTLTGDQDGTGVTQYDSIYGADNRPPNAFGNTPTGASTTYSTKYEFNYQEIERWWSHEINLVSTGNEDFQWLLGAYYFHESYEQPVYTRMPNAAIVGFPAFGPANPGLRIYDDQPHFESTSRALFGQIDWKFAPKWKTTLGIRDGDDHKSGNESVRVLGAPGTFLRTVATDLTPLPGTGIGTGVPAGPGVISTTYNPVTGYKTRVYDDKWQAVTGTAGVQYEPTDDTMIYAKYSRGYKSGGFRVGIDTSLGQGAETQKESNDAYELGLKTRFGNNFQLNVDTFYYNYQNAQVPLSQPAGGLSTVANSILYNVPKAVSKGIEIEATWHPLADLHLLANYSYLDARITEGSAIDPADACALAAGARQTTVTTINDTFGCGLQYFQNLKDYHLPNSSPNRVTFNANYNFHIGGGTLTPSATYIWRSEQFGSVFDRAYYKAPSWSQTDARITYKPEDGKYTLIAYGKNIFDDLGYANGATAFRRAGYTSTQPGFSGVFGQSSIYELTPPRTYGVEFQYRFF